MVKVKDINEIFLTDKKYKSKVGTPGKHKIIGKVEENSEKLVNQ